MVSFDCWTILDDGDRGVISTLAEQEISDELWGILLDLFGEKSLRNRARILSGEAYDECKDRYACGDCGLCAPYMQEPLIRYLAEVIIAYSSGCLTVDDGCYMIEEPDMQLLF